MELYEFRTTQHCRQIDHIKENGVHLASRVEQSQRFELFSLGKFYAEVSIDKGQMGIVRTFKTFTRLEPYLHNISLEGMLG